MKILKDVELKNYTTYKIGGPAEYLVEVETEEDFVEALKWAEQEGKAAIVFGGGSNVIVSDNGLEGLVIINKIKNFSIKDNLVTVSGGYSLGEFNQKLLEAGKGGLEFLANIPGSVGGAVAVNAGCYGKYVDAYLDKARVYDNGEIQIVEPDYFEFEYRSSKLKKGHKAVVLEATFKINDVPNEESVKLINEDRNLRDTKHPKDPSCGSFFKNPSRENTAGNLIEKAGLKGFKIGGAMVSDKHCNFLINTGNAKASDLKELSEYVRKTVKEKTGFELEEEVQYLGEF